MAANVMIYNPSEQLHNVALNQTIGRLTGTARSDLPRYLYCTQDVYDNYMSYNQNQEFLLDQLKRHNTVSSEFIQELSLPLRQTRNMDRSKVKIDPKLTYAQDDIQVSYHGNGDEETIDGVRMSNLRRWCTQECTDLPAQIIRYMLLQSNHQEQQQTLENRFGSSNVKNISGLRTQFGKIISKQNGIIMFNPNILHKITEFTQ